MVTASLMAILSCRPASLEQSGAEHKLQSSYASLASAARTESNVWTLGGLENSHRMMRAPCEMPYHGTDDDCGIWAAPSSNSDRASRVGQILRRMNSRASNPDLDHKIPGKAAMRILDQDTLVNCRRRVVTWSNHGQSDLSRPITSVGMADG